MNQIIPRVTLDSKKRRLIIAAILLVFLVAIGLTAKALFFAPTCFTADDYKKIYGDTPGANESFGPTKPFYSASYEFLPDSTSPTTDDNEAPDVTTEASIYTNNPSKQARYTISVTYDWTIANKKTLATKRAETIKSLLIKAGVPESIITIAVSPSVQQDTDEDDTDSSTDFASLTITSDTICHE